MRIERLGLLVGSGPSMGFVGEGEAAWIAEHMDVWATNEVR